MDVFNFFFLGSTMDFKNGTLAQFTKYYAERIPVENSVFT